MGGSSELEHPRNIFLVSLLDEFYRPGFFGFFAPCLRCIMSSMTSSCVGKRFELGCLGSG